MGEVWFARFNRVGACFAAVTGVMAWVHSAAAIQVPQTTECVAWTPVANTQPFLTDVPVEGLLLLPLKLGYGTIFGDQVVTTEPVVTAEVRDADGANWPGYLGFFAGYLDPSIGSAPMLWTSSRPFMPGAAYQLLLNVQNPPHCTTQETVAGELPAVPSTYDFVVAERPLPERLNEEVGDATVGLDWVRTEFTPQCCIARNTEHCADPAHCFACMKSAVAADLVVARTPTPVSAYLSHNVAVRGPDGEQASAASFSADKAEVRVRVPACLAQYCVEIAATSPLTEESAALFSKCIDGSEPRIAPAPDGAEIVPGDPCIDGSGPGTFRRAVPPDCTHYPDVRWFSDAADGFIALGIEPGPAKIWADELGTGGTGGTSGTTGGTAGVAGTSGGTAGTGGTRADDDGSDDTDWSNKSEQSGCACVTAQSGRGGDGAWSLLLALFAVRRRSRLRVG